MSNRQDSAPTFADRPRARPPLFAWLALLALYLLVLGHAALGDVVIGALVAALALWSARRVLPDRSPQPRPAWWARVWAIARVLAMILAAVPGSIPPLARLILGRPWAGRGKILFGRQGLLGGQPPPQPGVVTVATGSWEPPPTPNGLAVLGWLAMLIPGSLLAEIDAEKGILRFHLANKKGAPDFADRLRRIYAQQRKVLP